MPAATTMIPLKRVPLHWEFYGSKLLVQKKVLLTSSSIMDAWCCTVGRYITGKIAPQVASPSAFAILVSVFSIHFKVNQADANFELKKRAAMYSSARNYQMQFNANVRSHLLFHDDTDTVGSKKKEERRKRRIKDKHGKRCVMSLD